MNLQGKNAVVIGGVSGIGFECVKELLKNEVNKVVIIDYNQSLFDNVTAEISATFGANRISLYKCDITNSDKFEKVFNDVINELKTIDILHCNAGIIGEQIWRILINVNLTGNAHALFMGLKHMGKQNGGQGGSIVLTSSLAGLSGVDFAPTYTATKHALIGLTRSFGNAEYLKKSGVRVMAVCPGYTDTPLCTGKNLFLETPIDFSNIMSPTGNSKQKPESVAKCVIEMLKNGSEGSVYVVEDDKMYELDMPCIFKHTYKLKQRKI